ncbi:MAG: hypothetical protein HOC95_01825 [Candidatus Diapherotrites archaeon]|jgi:hypothetical protein|nr:hypothetical protein [Candidatus Diapherotrites archaeon]
MPKKAYHFGKTHTELRKTYNSGAPITFWNFRRRRSQNFAFLFEKLHAKPVGARVALDETRRDGTQVSHIYERTKRGCELVERIYHSKDFVRQEHIQKRR